MKFMKYINIMTILILLIQILKKLANYFLLNTPLLPVMFHTWYYT